MEEEWDWIDAEQWIPLLELLALSDYVPTKTEYAFLEKTTALYFGYGSKATNDVVKGLTYMPQLQVLNLSGTNINNIDSLSHLTNLQALYLSATEISDIKPLVSLTNLRILNLYETKISNVEPLAHLINLQALNLSDTKIISIKSLSGLTNLQVLDLSNTRITNIKSLSGLTNLQELYLSNTGITSINPLCRLINLQRLNLAGTKFKSLEPLINLHNLQTLNLRDTEIVNIKPLAYLTDLQTLNLRGTKITCVEQLSKLTSMKHLVLSEVTLPSIPRALVEMELPFYTSNNDSLQENTPGIWLFNTTLTNQPIDLFEQDPATILAYYDAQEKILLRDCKIVLLGDGGVGKTHTLRRILNHGKPLTSSPDPTPGIDIQDRTARKEDFSVDVVSYTPNQSDLQLHFWDFGGQVIMHSMHRCFLTQHTCYVVVVGNRQRSLTHQARYWLNNIKSFAPDSPVLLAVNKWAGVDTWELDLPLLKREYPQLHDTPLFYCAAMDTKEEFDRLTQKMIELAETQVGKGQLLPKAWAEVREALLELSVENPHLDTEKYCQLCAQHGLTGPHEQAGVLRLFTNSGVCFSTFSQKSGAAGLIDFRVMEPKWLTNALYIIINQGQSIDKRGHGRIPKDSLQELLIHPTNSVLADVDYSKQIDYILDVLRSFRLSYPFFDENDGEEKEFIPALCQNDSPTELELANLKPAHYSSVSRFQLEYKFLPDSVLQRLMVQCCSDGCILSQSWRRGFCWKDKKDALTTIVTMDDDQQLLKLEIYSEQGHSSCGALNYLRRTLAQINTFMAIQPTEVLLMEQNGQTARFPMLAVEQAWNQGCVTLQSLDGGQFEEYPMDIILRQIFEPDAVPKPHSSGVPIMNYYYIDKRSYTDNRSITCSYDDHSTKTSTHMGDGNTFKHTKWQNNKNL